MIDAEDCNYWNSGKSSPDVWLEKIIKLIKDFGGEILSSGYGSDSGKSAYMIRFTLESETFKIVWPVLHSKSGNEFAARRQAVTMLYHDVKSKCVSSQVLGVRLAFFSWVELEDGRTMFQLSDNELSNRTPKLLGGSQ